MAKRKKHKECATPDCHNIVSYRGKKGAICGLCRRKLKEVQLVEEVAMGQLDDGKLAERLSRMKI